ncbi:zinc-binding metallopeptidase family protein [Rhodovulum sp. DZ06]|uniref:zinc-binding metallopeptidase family protein n=1 Tax=Rhodovulum sp. DZ06 TaxID=3425126 RepID=UPI003D3446CA
MRPLTCPACGARVFFDNLDCPCGAAVAYLPDADVFALLGDGDGAADGPAEGAAPAAPCANREAASCNWAADAPGALCRSCAMTVVFPDLSVGENRALWVRTEAAKRRVLRGLGRWGWFTLADPGPRPEFHMLSEDTASGETRVMMGHLSGAITINVTEADPAERVARREAFDEPYRTVAGHFRHEIGHFLFERLAAEPGFSDAFRALFGDERADYGEALAAHHANGAPPDWAARHVSAYASAHPHEDWAESFAHVLHLWAILGGFVGEGLSAPCLPHPDYDPYAAEDGAEVIQAAGELCISLNAINRAMGIGDLYPFVLSETAREKLVFAHSWLRAGPGAG